MSLLTPESATEFSEARKYALREAWLSFFTGRPNDLLSFEEVKQNLRLQDSSYKGLQEVELDKIVGSVGRYRDFTRTFLPKSDQTELRWRKVDAVVHEQGLPPIEVFKVADVYFVSDGNHRVSVARAHQAETIEAYVIEYKTSVPVEKDDDLDDLLLKMEHSEFFEQTKLNVIRPEQTVKFTEPGRYRLVKEHIAFHKYLIETEHQTEISYEEAVASWYDNVYMPVIDHIRGNEILTDFPGRTEADLYGWLLLHRSALEQEVKALGYVHTEDLIEKLKRERSTNPFARLMGLFRHDLDLHSLSLKTERLKFLEETGLDTIRPDHTINFTEAGCYSLTKKHIDVHKYLKETQCDREIPYSEAVGSWYDNVYTPLVKLVIEHGLLSKFPKHTEADIYLWLVSYREDLEKEYQAFGQIPDETIIKALEEETASPITRLMQFFQQKLHLTDILLS